VSVVVGVLVAVGFSVAVGFTWWSLVILIAAGLVLGYALRLGDHILEVPISAMLILSIATRAAATSRILETLVGAGAGLAGGLVFPPLRVQPAEEAIADLSRDLAGLLDGLATDLEGAGTGTAGSRLSRARAFTREIGRVDRALAESEESLRLNPRGRSRPHAGAALRDGLETLEHVAVTVRGITRSVADAASLDGGLIGDEESRQQLVMTLHKLAGAVGDFGELVRADIMTGRGGPEIRRRAEEDLLRRLSEARHHQEALGERLRAAPAAGGPGWPLQGELLTHLSRLHDELQPENRARARERWPRPGIGWPGRLAARLNLRQPRRAPGSGRGEKPLTAVTGRWGGSQREAGPGGQNLHDRSRRARTLICPSVAGWRRSRILTPNHRSRGRAISAAGGRMSMPAWARPPSHRGCRHGSSFRGLDALSEMTAYPGNIWQGTSTHEGRKGHTEATPGHTPGSENPALACLNRSRPTLPARATVATCPGDSDSGPARA
jgi:hypothetical protein